VQRISTNRARIERGAPRPHRDGVPFFHLDFSFSSSGSSTRGRSSSCSSSQSRLSSFVRVHGIVDHLSLFLRKVVLQRINLKKERKKERKEKKREKKKTRDCVLGFSTLISLQKRERERFLSWREIFRFWIFAVPPLRTKFTRERIITAPLT
jgi:hypothetical protein